jgi:SAP domain
MDDSKQPADPAPQILNVKHDTSSEMTLAIDQSKFIELAARMKNEGKIKTDVEFAKNFMFAFDNNPEKFCVNLELLIEYEVYDSKGHAKRALIKNFTDGTDYQSQKSCLPLDSKEDKKASHGGNNKELIMLTVDCFKLMCVIANSNAGKTVRRYYIDLEQVFKAYIVDEFKKSEMLRIKAEKLHQQNLQRHRYFKFGRKGPVFYIIVSGLQYTDGIIRIKIGEAGAPESKPKKCKKCGHKPVIKNPSQSLDSRLSSHRTLWPQLQVLFVAYTIDAKLLEKCIKRQYKEKINPSGHEIIEGVTPDELLETTMRYLQMFDTLEKEPSYLIEENLEMYNQQALMPIRKALEDVEERVMAKLEFIEEKMVEHKTELKESINNLNNKYAELLPLIKDYKLPQLQSLCRELNITVRGKKAELLERLQLYLNNRMRGV